MKKPKKAPLPPPSVPAAAPGNSPRPNLKFHYLKQPEFKTSLATGVVGGITIQGLIDMNFYLDRSVIPRISEGVIINDQLKEVFTDARDGSIREVVSGIIMDLNTAKAFSKWLTEKIEALENIPRNKK